MLPSQGESWNLFYQTFSVSFVDLQILNYTDVHNIKLHKLSWEEINT